MAKFTRVTFLLAAGALALFAVSTYGSRLSIESPPAYASSQMEAPAAAPISAQVVNGEEDHHGMWGDSGGWGWWLFVPMMIVFWIGVVALIVWLARQWGSSSQRSSDAIEIARQRYARGEISSEQFDQIRRDLNS